LPVASLEAYMGKCLPEASGPLTVEQFPHGHSNLTYLLRMGDKEFVLRRPPLRRQRNDDQVHSCRHSGFN
jgi:aminoglycoside phosphotransferase (APT) family kinase protein